MRELVIISGKGGTGKTSVMAALACSFSNCVLADCDVDAADLHLLLAPSVLIEEEFRAGLEAAINPPTCRLCGLCLSFCRFDAVHWTRQAGDARLRIDPIACEGCGVCANHCPANAIELHERVSGMCYVSETRRGPMVHARLRAGGENSGKLVSLVRRRAQETALQLNKTMVLVDGPPGIGCPVIASITGASAVLAVTEPTPSGRHDLERVMALARHFKMPVGIVVNKWDLNPALSEAIASDATALSMTMLGRVRYDVAVVAAQMAGKTIMEMPVQGGAYEDVCALVEHVQSWLMRISNGQGCVATTHE